MTKHVLRSFYRPHARVTFDNSMVNPWTGEVTYPPSRTKQEFARECDINNILKQFSQTGMLRHVSARAAQGTYEDLPDQVDFQTALGIVEEARQSFMSLPSKLRARFDNEPAQFLAFLSDPSNRAEALSLGLLNPPPGQADSGPGVAAAASSGGAGGTPPAEGAKAP